jgi:hypothetical protein
VAVVDKLSRFSAAKIVPALSKATKPNKRVKRHIFVMASFCSILVVSAIGFAAIVTAVEAFLEGRQVTYFLWE